MRSRGRESLTHTDCGGERLERQERGTDQGYAGKAGKRAEQLDGERLTLATVAEAGAAVAVRCAAQRALVADDDAVGLHGVGLRRRAMPMCPC